MAGANLRDDRCNAGCRGDVPARGEQVDISRYVSATLAPANGTLVVYSPGYEEQRAQFSEELSFGRIPFAEPVLCIRSIGGPFEFNIDIISIEDLD